MTNYIEEKVERWLGLSINREKTRCVKLPEEGDLCGWKNPYLNIEPSKKAQQRERDRLKEMTGPGMCYKPVTDMTFFYNIILL